MNKLNIEDRFHNYFNLGLIGIAVTSLEKGWVEVNDKLCEILGYPREELIELSWAEITYPDDVEADEAEFEQVLSGEIDGYSIDKRFIRKDGRVIYTSISVNCIKREHERGNQFVAFIQDITDRKQTEEALKDSERKSRAWLENSPACTKMLDLDFNLQYMSNAGISALGIDDVTTFYGKPYPFDFYPESFNKAMIENLESARETGEIITQEAEVIDLEGTSMWFQSTIVPVKDDDGRVDYIIVVSLETTKRKHAEKKLEEHRDHLEELVKERTSELRNEIAKHKSARQKLQESERRLSEAQRVGNIGSYTLNILTRKVSGTDMLYLILGLQKNIEYSITDCVEILHPDSRDILTTYFQKVLDTNIRFNKDYLIVRPSDGETRWLHSVGELQYDDNDNVISMIGTTQDITDRKRLEEELLKSRKLESVGLLAGGIAHDFNNILTGLFGNLSLAKMKLAPDHIAYPYIQTANKALSNASNLTKRLLTFAKGGDPILEVLDINEVIQDSVEFTLSGSNIKKAFSLADNLWQVKADKGQLSQVITNLVMNATQAMTHGGTLYIEAKNIKDIDKSIALHLTGDFVEFSIRDEGLGISTEHLEKIFDPYFTTKQTGRGLGLATIHSIISKHDGYITVNSNLGVGTTFTIYLPADHSLPKTLNSKPLDIIEIPVNTAGHILVMDDDEMILNLSREIIETYGYTVDTAVDGKEAIDKYTSAQKCGKGYNIVIMDLTIPGGMGGKEAVKKLIDINPEVKVIVSSGYSTDPVMANFREYGFKGRLVKPFQMDELQEVLSQHIATT